MRDITDLMNAYRECSRNLWNVYEQSTGLALVSLGQTLVILTGGIDLSVGSMISLLSELISGSIDGDGALVLPVLAGVIVLGALLGAINGACIVLLRGPPAHCHARHRRGAAGADAALFESSARQSARRL